MNKFSFLITLFVAMLTGIVIVSSCSGDDDDESGIVGTWRTRYDDTSGSGDGHEYMMFCSDGTCYHFEECSSHGYHADKADYIYNESTGKLKVVYDNYGLSYTETVNVEISGNKMIIDAGSGSLVYNRCTSPVSKSQLEKYCRDDQGSR